jgi:hypothetical protein
MTFPRTAAASSLGSRQSRAIADEEQRGLTFAFRARTVAVLAVMVWLVLARSASPSCCSTRS